jgi:hypothetical protein
MRLILRNRHGDKSICDDPSQNDGSKDLVGDKTSHAAGAAIEVNFDDLPSEV